MASQIIQVVEDAVAINGGGIEVVEGVAVVVTIKPVREGAAGSCQHGVTSKCDITLERLSTNRFEVCGV